MKNLKYILILIVFAILVFVVVKMGSKVEPVSTVNETPEAQEPSDVKWPIELCFAKFGALNENGFADNYTLRMSLNKENVTGELNFIPAEKDRKTGEIQGTVGPVDKMMMARTADLWWFTFAEGMSAKEQLKIIFGEGTASIGFGEMVEGEDGAYVYKNPEKINYSLDLTDVACTDLVERANVEDYLRENIATLSPMGSVLGGTWYYISSYIDLRANSGTVIYEDGHIMEESSFSYTVNELHEVIEMKVSE